MGKLTMVQALNLALRQEMNRDPDVVVLGEDVGVDGGVFRVTEGLLGQFGAERVIDTPLAEAAIVGASIGMALYGLKPVCEIQFLGFLYQAFHQLKSHASRFRSRSRGRYPCPIVVRAPYGGGIRAVEEHSESTETYFIHTPGLKVVVPSTPRTARGLLVSAIRDPDPVVFLEPTRAYRSPREEVPEEEEMFPLGVARVVHEGDDLTLVTWGAMLHVCLRAVEQAREEHGYRVEVIDLLTLSPVDMQTVISSVEKTGRAVVVHEAPRTLGFGAEISARLNEEALLSLQAPIRRVTGYDVPVPLFAREPAYLPDEERILQGIQETMQF
ncbi:MAG: alpha-ketoacid dehydrogenase subunit beta [Nitrospinae bacterium]|nr:alpha-ketoacid dehydrogenase subunit beta [Nitrospinota bacterium]